MGPKRKLKAIWDADDSKSTMQSLTTAFTNLDIDMMSPPPIKRIPITFGEEVQENIDEWCASQGITIPSEYIGYGAKIDAERYAETIAELNRLEDEEKAQEAAPAGEKPAFGTPAFWAWARKRKAEKEKEAAAKASAKP